MDYQEAITLMELVKEAYSPKFMKDAVDVAISGMQELQMYKDAKLCLIPEEVFAKQCEEMDAYKQLGTLEEVQEAMERQQAKKAILDKPIMILCCPSCGSYLQKVVDDEGSTEGFIPMYCKDCGQKIDADWSEEK